MEGTYDKSLASFSCQKQLQVTKTSALSKICIIIIYQKLVLPQGKKSTTLRNLRDVVLMATTSKVNG